MTNIIADNAMHYCNFEWLRDKNMTLHSYSVGNTTVRFADHIPLSGRRMPPGWHTQGTGTDGTWSRHTGQMTCHRNHHSTNTAVGHQPEKETNKQSINNYLNSGK